MIGNLSDEEVKNLLDKVVGKIIDINDSNAGAFDPLKELTLDVLPWDEHTCQSNSFLSKFTQKLMDKSLYGGKICHNSKDFSEEALSELDKFINEYGPENLTDEDKHMIEWTKKYLEEIKINYV